MTQPVSKDAAPRRKKEEERKRPECGKNASSL
jgi:hypothetical protein